MSTDEVPTFVHVMAAIVWIAGARFHIFASTRLASASDAVALLVGVGMVLVADGIGSGEPWIVLGFAGIVASAVVGAVFIERTTRETAAALQSQASGEGALAGRPCATTPASPSVPPTGHAVPARQVVGRLG